MAMHGTTLVIGARHTSLGEAVLLELTDNDAEELVVTAGISGAAPEDRWVDVTDPVSVDNLFDALPGGGRQVNRVVYTAGRNGVGRQVLNPQVGREFLDMADVHVSGMLLCLGAFMRKTSPAHLSSPQGGRVRQQFVAISSNSAHIARSNSVAYCASKAAQSMAIRVAAREMAQMGEHGDAPLVYGYEFGLLAGTPMTEALKRRLGPTRPLSRMLGAESGLSVGAAARHIVDGLRNAHQGLNGTLIRIDSGEQ